MNTLGAQLNNREAQLDVLEGVLMNQNLKDRVYPQGRPVGAGWISSYFGKRTDPFTGKAANHTGIDFAGKKGAEISPLPMVWLPGLQIVTATASWLRSITALVTQRAMRTIRRTSCPSATKSRKGRSWP